MIVIFKLKNNLNSNVTLFPVKFDINFITSNDAKNENILKTLSGAKNNIKSISNKRGKLKNFLENSLTFYLKTLNFFF